MAGKETVRVVPFQVRRAGKDIDDVGDELKGTAGVVRFWSDSAGSLQAWEVGGAAKSLISMWSTYLSRLGGNIAGHGELLVKVANAYALRDREAAEALGVALPKDGPTDVRVRPGRVPM